MSLPTCCWCGDPILRFGRYWRHPSTHYIYCGGDFDRLIAPAPSPACGVGVSATVDGRGADQ